MEHGYTLQTRPFADTGAAVAEPVRIELGAKQMRVAANNDGSLGLGDEVGHRFRYGHLIVTDTMAIAFRRHSLRRGASIEISFDGRGARYPQSGAREVEDYIVTIKAP